MKGYELSDLQSYIRSFNEDLCIWKGCQDSLLIMSVTLEYIIKHKSGCTSANLVYSFNFIDVTVHRVYGDHTVEQ